jgi:hypothetical protein
VSVSYYLVLSNPPETVSDEEYNDWYDIHVRELVDLPGFVAAERFDAQFLLSRAVEPPTYRFATRYEIRGDFDAAIGSLREAVDEGKLVIPEWLVDITSGGWRLQPKGPVVRASRDADTALEVTE